MQLTDAEAALIAALACLETRRETQAADQLVSLHLSCAESQSEQIEMLQRLQQALLADAQADCDAQGDQKQNYYVLKSRTY